MSRSRSALRAGSIAFFAGIGLVAAPSLAQFKLPGGGPKIPIGPLPGKGRPPTPPIGPGVDMNGGNNANAQQNVTAEDLEFLPPSTDPAELNLSCDAAWAKLAEDLKSSKPNPWVQAVRIGGMPLATFINTNSAKVQDARARRALSGPLPVLAFDAAVANAATFLVKELPLDPAIAKAQSKQVLSIKTIDIEKGTPKFNSPALEVALESLHAKLASNDSIRANFLVLSSRAAKSEEALKAAGAGKTWTIGNATGEPGLVKSGEYHPDTIYIISGRFYQSPDFDKHRLYLSTIIDVTQARTGALIKSKPIGAEYRFHPYRLDWISAAEDEALARAPKP